MSENPSAVVNLSAYRFAALEDLPGRRESLLALTGRLELRGTILLAPEGINLFVAGPRQATDELMQELRRDPAFADMEAKESLSDYQPFNRMLVRIKKEIIAFGIDGVNPVERSSPKMSAAELKAWLDEGRPVHLLDVRNDYEVEVGSFEHAIPARIDSFRDFPEAVQRLPESMKQEPVVMFCTGGIRCEKAGPYMEQAGFQEVYQLDGGILKYFEECGDQHYRGSCFVFDQRVAVDGALQETGFAQCYACQAVVSPADQESAQYVVGRSCPQCWKPPAEQQSELLQRRQDQLLGVATPLPGAEPYFNRRPLNVPARYAGLPLIDFLCDWHPHISRDTWLQKITSEQVVPAPQHRRRRSRRRTAEEALPLDPQRQVRPGERFEHLLPGSQEPDVCVDVRWLYEDADWIVVSKPAPLPLHASGRFHRNTLQYLLNEVYAPERPHPVHRLDANTTGVLLLGRRRSAARDLQRQFEDRTVSKEYLVRVHGQPDADSFRCDARISREPGEHGTRSIDEGGLEALTEFRVLHRLDDGSSLLTAVPLTGRTNQIRLHLWHLGWPVMNDPVWQPDGPPTANRTRTVDEPPMCLHAWSLAVNDAEGRRRRFTAPPPSWWAAEIPAAVPAVADS